MYPLSFFAYSFQLAELERGIEESKILFSSRIVDPRSLLYFAG